MIRNVKIIFSVIAAIAVVVIIYIFLAEGTLPDENIYETNGIIEQKKYLERRVTSPGMPGVVDIKNNIEEKLIEIKLIKDNRIEAQLLNADYPECPLGLKLNNFEYKGRIGGLFSLLQADLKILLVTTNDSYLLNEKDIEISKNDYTLREILMLLTGPSESGVIVTLSPLPKYKEEQYPSAEALGGISITTDYDLIAIGTW